MDTNVLQQTARDYLAEQLGPRQPDELTLAATFDEHPLETEGDCAAFSFDLAPGPDTPPEAAGHDQQHYVIVGQTEPNYYPAYKLDPSDAYSLHLGTRFMLELGGAVAPPEDEPAAAREQLRAFILACNPGESIEQVLLAALYRCEDQLFAVYRVTLRGQDVYCFGADCPPGFAQRTDLPPLVALRAHLGALIRHEARQAAGRNSQP